MLRWQPGRQGTGYRKLELGGGTCWDAYLIDYPPGVGIPIHADSVPGKRHLRINIALRTGRSRLTAEAVVFRLGERVVIFWSDRPHAVSPNASRRLVASFGLAV